jgi:hypothetical protein
MVPRRRWAVHVAYMGEKRKVYRVFCEHRGKETTFKTIGQIWVWT